MESDRSKPEQFERFEALAKKLLKVPKKDISKAEHPASKTAKSKKPKPA